MSYYSGLMKASDRQAVLLVDVILKEVLLPLSLFMEWIVITQILRTQMVSVVSFCNAFVQGDVMTTAQTKLPVCDD